MKQKVRNAILGFMAAAMATTYFVGCAGSIDDQSNTSSPYTSQTSSSSITIVDDTITPGITDSDSNSFSIKYKYWYDNPEVAEAQTALTPTVQTPTGDMFLDTWKIYTDSDGNEFIMSGRTPIYLHDNKISEIEVNLLRTDTGVKLYPLLNMAVEDVRTKLDEFSQALADSGCTQPATYEERVELVAGEIDEAAAYKLYVNNMNTELTVTNNTIDIRNIFAYSVTGMVKGNTVELFTASGLVKITFEDNGDGSYTVEYSTDEDSRDTLIDEVVVSDTSISMTLEAVETFLGYDVEVYDDFINIVTDNMDIPNSTSPVTIAFGDLGKITTPADQTETEKVEQPDQTSPEDDQTSSDDETPASKPSVETVEVNGKTYEITETDIKNPDGTYTAEYVIGAKTPGTGTVITEDTMPSSLPWLAGKPHPSKIPYSQITVENAAEAFPYLGWIGHVPDYVEVEPGMTADEIKSVIAKNFNGVTPGGIPQNPRYVYSSEAEYNQYLADQQAAAEAAKALGAQAQADWDAIARGEASIGGNLSEEENQAIIDEFKDKFGW